jgi:hypothetical protein
MCNRLNLTGRTVTVRSRPPALGMKLDENLLVLGDLQIEYYGKGCSKEAGEL